MNIQKNILHYYVDLLRIRNGKTRTADERNNCINALHNVIRTVSCTRHNHVCAEDFTYLDWGTISFDDIDFSLNGKHPCAFSNSIINRWNFVVGLQDSLNDFFYISSINKLIVYSDKEIVFWDLKTKLPYSIIYASEFDEDCYITTVKVMQEDNIFIIGTDLGYLYIRLLTAPNKNLYCFNTDEEITHVHYYKKIDKLITVHREYDDENENGSAEYRITIKCWAVNKFCYSNPIWEKVVFTGDRFCIISFTSNYIVASHHSDNDKTTTKVIWVNNGTIRNEFDDDGDLDYAFVSINENIIALSLSNESYFVSIHFINSMEPSFIIENAILACSDSSPFSNDSSGFYYIAQEEQLLFYDLTTHTESLLVSLPPPIDPRDRRGQCWMIEMASDCEYGVIWDYEDRYFLLNIESKTISKIDLRRLPTF